MAITKILVIQTAFISDVILVTPLVKALKQLYPASEIDVMVIPGAAKLLENNPHIRAVISFAKRRNTFISML